MIEIIEYIKTIINNTKNEIDSYKKINDEAMLTIETLDNYLLDLGSINELLLDSIFSNEIINTEDFKKAVFYIKYFDGEFKNESQVLIAKEYFRNVLNNKKEEIESLIETNKTIIDLKEKEKEELDETSKLLQDYNDDVYINEDELEKIIKVITGMNYSDEVIRLLITIGKNNYKIEESRIKEAPKTEIIDYREDIRYKVETDINEDDIALERKKYIMMYNQFKADESFKEKYPDLYRKIDYILGNYDEEIKAMDKDTIALISMLFDKEDSCEEDFKIKLINSVLNNNIELINKNVKEYENSSKRTYYEILNLCEKYDILKNINKSSDYIIPNFETSNIYNKVKAIKESNLSEETVKLTKEEKKRYQITSCIEDLELTISISEKPFSPEVEQILEEKNNQLELLLEEMKQIQEENKSKTNNGTNKTEDTSIYDDNFSNYMVFLKIDEFDNMFEELKKEKHDVTYEDLLSKFNKLVSSTPQLLSNPNNTKNIHKGEMTPNDKEILELRGGCIRVGIKRVENGEINGHPVYLVIGVSYGNCGGLQKSRGLQQNLKMFDKYENIYNDICQICSKEKNSNKISDEAKELIDEGIDYYKIIEERNKSVRGGHNL